ncbi:MAG: pyridoxamine 5'-phosphate oxidase family protein [Gammaproteobacteria bacterium]|nr:pyridoxamine 5'-phosphate oxidase family protein [Gammaproteobacteria bacterium]
MNKYKTDKEQTITTDSHFHVGEQEIQSRMGVRESMERFSKQVIASFMPEQHREFYKQLPFIMLGHADKKGWPWATMLFNEDGFVTSKNNKKLTINSKPITGEPFAELLQQSLQQSQQENTRIGMLGIELSTRRRNRLAGHITQVNDTAIEIEVDQAFGNCPQYIQMRELIKIDSDAQKKPDVSSITSFDKKNREFIQNSDTFFVASYVNNENKNANINEGVDVSHRGGRPGFIRVDSDDTLTIPDYTGNFHFNTLGNFLLTPKAGLLFPDFETGNLLTLTGTVEILWDSEETEFFEGAERLWRFKIDHGFWMKNALPLRWKLDKYSPNTLLTGTWDEAKKIQQAEAEKNQWQDYKVTKILKESSVIKSFYLSSVKNQQPLFSAGQFITVKALIDNKEVIRTYTVSSSPHDSDYRISVKHETSNNENVPDGVFSSYLHNETSVGDTLQIKAATGDFTFDAQSERPSVLIAAGVGITPMISMARYALVEALRTRSRKKLTVIHAAQDHTQRAFFEELKEIEKSSSGNIRCFWTLSKIDNSLKAGEHYNHHGRINNALLQAVLPLDDYDFYLCGPPGFMQATYDLLRELGVNDQRISAESFGPASLERRSDHATESFQQIPVAKEAIVEFTKSKVKQAWTEGDGTLLEFAEAHGLLPEYGCRSGQCGSCKVKLNAGKVSYNQLLQTTVKDDEVLLCCAMPAESSGDDIVKIEIHI